MLLSVSSSKVFKRLGAWGALGLRPLSGLERAQSALGVVKERLHSRLTSAITNEVMVSGWRCRLVSFRSEMEIRG